MCIYTIIGVLYGNYGSVCPHDTRSGLGCMDNGWLNGLYACCATLASLLAMVRTDLIVLITD